MPIPAERIESRILVIRGHRVMLDADLAEVYGVTTRRLNEQVKRNIGRFPADFLIRLTEDEKVELVAKCDRFNRLSAGAIEASVSVVRAFVRMREALMSTRELARRLDALEKKYDAEFKMVFDAIRALMEPPKKPRRKIGFHTD